MSRVSRVFSEMHITSLRRSPTKEKCIENQDLLYKVYTMRGFTKLFFIFAELSTLTRPG